MSVVLPVYNAAATLGQQLAALAAQRCPHKWEVVLADNGSTDTSVAVARGYRHLLPRLRVVSATGKQGAGYARNRGVEAADGDAILFCDADDVVAPGWLTGMVEGLQTHRFVACRYDFHKLNPAWATTPLGTPQANGPQQITFLPFLCAGGGGMGIHRDIHEAVRGFDEDIVFLEDIDYCQRVQEHGVPLAPAPDALVYCRRPVTMRGIYAQARNWAQYEQLLFRRYCRASLKEFWRWRAFVQQTLAYARRLPYLLRTPEGRALCAWRIGRQVGCLKGCLKYGVSPITGY